jgi:hypothetical protein
LDVIYTKISGTIASDHTVLAHGQIGIFADKIATPDAPLIQGCSQYEFYLGKFSSTSTESGVGLAMTGLVSGSGTVSDPSVSSSNYTEAATFIKDYLASDAYLSATGGTSCTLITKSSPTATVSPSMPADKAAALASLTTLAPLWAAQSTVFN